MGWSERGKKGVRIKTRTNCFSEGVLVKYQNNTTNTPSSDITSVLQDRYGLIDGLDLNYVPGNDQVVFSLGKRKRWLLPELVKERVDEDVAVEGQDENELHLCFQTRYIHEQIKRARVRGDCVSIYSDHEGEIKPKHKYAFYSDIRHKDKDSKPPEVGYEICLSPPSTSWPNFCQDKLTAANYSFHPNEKKSKCKGKRSKNKGYRLDSLCEDDFYDEGYSKVRQNDCKVKTVSKSDFLLAAQKMDSDKDAGHSFRLDEFVNEQKKQDSGKVKDEKFKVVTSGFTKYGKGCVVYIDSDAKKTQNIVPQQSNIKSWKAHQECSVSINIDADEFKVSSLKAEWGECYSEAAVSPRKFAINVSSLLPKNQLSSNRIANVLFEVQDNASKDNTQVSIAVKLVYALIDGKSELRQAAQDFASFITRTTGTSRTWQVREVVAAALQCIKVLTGQSSDETSLQPQTAPIGKPFRVTNLNFLNEICGWQSEAFTLKEAQQQIQEKIENESKNTKRSDVTESQWTMLSVECGICYEQFEDNDINQVTSLKECGHSFCNECWVGHLDTQVSQGMEHLKCPGYDCDCRVDNITVMCLVPELYERFFNMRVNRHLETSPEWKWCPGKHCKRVVKAMAKSDDAFTVLCSCQSVWCFKCKKQSHWPASCAESEKFIQQSGDLNNLLRVESKETITSVMVKNCPKCDYPIEKFLGCQFLRCVLCNAHFCWNCLHITSYDHRCENKPSDEITEVMLNPRNKRYEIQKYLNIILHSIKARKQSLLIAKRKKIKALETGLASHFEVTSQHVLPKEESDSSLVTKLMKDFVRNRIPENVQDAVEFEFQAHLALEGFAQKAAMSKSHVKISAFSKMSQLAFILERIDIMLQETLLCKDENIKWLKQLVEIGKDCVVTLKTSSSKGQH